MKYTAPQGYDSSYRALIDVLRYGPGLWGPSGTAVMLFHIERTISYGKLSDQHSISQAEEGCYSKREQGWVRGPSGVRRTAFKAQNALLEASGVLRREPRFTTKGGSAPTEYEPDWLGIRAAIEQWQTSHQKPSRTPLLDDDSGAGEAVENQPPVAATWPPPGRETATPPESAEEGTPDWRGVGDPPGRLAATPGGRLAATQASLSQPADTTSRLDTSFSAGVEKGGFALPVSGARAPEPLHSQTPAAHLSRPKTPSLEAGKHGSLQKAGDILRDTGLSENARNLARASGIREALEAAWGTIGPKSNIPGRLLAIADKLQLPALALEFWIHQFAAEKRARGYVIQKAALFITAAGENLIAWAQQNWRIVQQCREQEALNAAAPAPAEVSQIPIFENEGELYDGEQSHGGDAEQPPFARSAGS